MAYRAMTTGGGWCAACGSSHWCYRCHDGNHSKAACSMCGRQPTVVHAVPPPWQPLQIRLTRESPFNNAYSTCTKCGSVFATHRCSLVAT